MANAIPIATKAMRVGETLVRGARFFQRGLVSSLKFGNDKTSRVAEKLNMTNKKVVAQTKKNEEIKQKTRDDEKRRAKEEELEVKSKNGPIRRFLKTTIKNSISAMWKLLAAWAIKNLPAIIKQVEIITKKVRVFVAAVNGAVRGIGGVFTSLVSITKAFIKNISEFDFNDSSGRIQKASDELSTSMDEVGASFGEMKDVWGREEYELDAQLKKLTETKSLREAVDAALNAVPEAVPTTPAVGSDAGGGSTP